MIWLLAVVSAVSANVVGVDFGSEFIKIAVVKPGKKLVIVENEETKRMTFSGFAFNGKETLSSSKALFKYMKNPELAVKNPKNFLGLDFSSPQVSEILNKTFSAVSIARAQLGGVEFEMLGRKFTAEEVSGLVLQNIARIVDTFAGTSLKDCVISIPSLFSRQEKHALMAAVKVAGLNLLNFVYDNSAAALYYSMDRVDDVTDHVLLVLNFGSSYTQVSVVSLWGYYENDKYVSFVQPLGHLSTTEFAGYVIDYELSELAIQDFLLRHKVDLHSYPKAMSKVWKEVSFAKPTLSTIKKTQVFIENIVDELSLKFDLTQEMIDSVVLKHKSKFLKLIDDLLLELNLPLQAINNVELIGGVSKIPKIQEVIESHLKSKVSFHIHPTEATAYGAALLAAKEGASVSTKPFTLLEVSSCSISFSTCLEQETIFRKNTELKSKKTVEVQIPETNSLTLVESCGSPSKYYTYTFSEAGLLSLSFSLDSKGLSFLVSARQEGSSVKFKSKDESSPQPMPEETLEKLMENLKTFQSSVKENELLLKARNDIEAVLYYLKDKLQEDDFQQVMNETEQKVLQQYVEDTENWLKSAEFPTATELQIKEQIWKIRSELVTVLEKENDLKVREKLIQDGRGYIEKLKQFMNMVNETTWIPRTEVNEAWHVLLATEKWLEEKIEEQKTLKNWQSPAISAKEFDNKFLFLRSQLERFANYKPPESETS